MGLTVRLVRHGQTDWSTARRYCGHTDVALNLDGRSQARVLAAIADASYTSCWTSDLARCVETARLMGVDAAPTADLREFDFGEIEGRRWAELEPATRRELAEFDGFQAPGGENVVRFGARVDAFVDRLGLGHHLLITHGGVIRHLQRRSATETDIGPGTWRDIEL